MRFKYCAYCAQPLIKQDDTLYTCPEGHEMYNEPAVAVAVVMLDGDSILVSRRAREPRKGTYDLPGGFCNYAEGWQDAAVREVQEETGMEVERDSLELIDAHICDYKEHETVMDLIVLAKHWHGTPIEALDDSESLEWQPLTFLEGPKFCAPYPGLRAKLERLLAEVTL